MKIQGLVQKHDRKVCRGTMACLRLLAVLININLKHIRRSVKHKEYTEHKTIRMMHKKPVTFCNKMNLSQIESEPKTELI